MTAHFKLFISILLVVYFSCSTSPERLEEIKDEKNLRREIKYGRLITSGILKKYPQIDRNKPKNIKIKRYVNKVGKAVALFAGRSDIDYHFTILKSDHINAYAAPGGFIFITLGALKAMENEAQLAAVLGHEIAHVNHKHIMKILDKTIPPKPETGFLQVMTSILSAQGTVVSAAASQAASQATKILFEKGLKHADELQADLSAIDYTKETGYDINGLHIFLGIIQESKERSGKEAVYNTHPPLKDRIEDIKKYIKEEGFEDTGKELADRFESNITNLL